MTFGALETEPLAHSAPTEGAQPDPYARHVRAVRSEARTRAEAMLLHATVPPPGMLEAIDVAATFHDLGKLDPLMQAALRRGRTARPERSHDHIDAGVAHLSACRNWMAAWMVRAHHAPGLPRNAHHFDADRLGRRLRGVRHDDVDVEAHERQIARTDARLLEYLADHARVADPCAILPQKPIHGLAMRLALSCLVDADHADTAWFDTQRRLPPPPEPRWAERLQALREYVGELPVGRSREERDRNRRRGAFFATCLNASISEPLVACEGSVGLGKTTAVAAYLVRRAKEEGLRRLIVVAPYTNILTQTARVLRQALVLPDEQDRADQVVVEHHHRADFDHPEDRDLAALWRAPVVLTTAVSFFETLAGSDPGTLRKLHAVPGSAIFIDEAHAALPTELWPRNWRWLRELAIWWGCRVVFASGSLVRFWEHPDIVAEPVKLPELLPPEQAHNVGRAERHRVRYEQLEGGRALDVADLIGLVRAAPGPRLVILNTVQSAAVVASAMRDADLDVLHLSTALAPCHREAILDLVKSRLRAGGADWTLVATSCVEAGVDLSFRCAFRERFATASILQVAGRVNRHGEYDPDGGAVVYDFVIEDAGITHHPAADVAANVLREIMSADWLNTRNPADVATDAMQRELSACGGLGADRLGKAEDSRDYPMAKKYGRVITEETRIVVVDQRLAGRLAGRGSVDFRELLNGSVQLWSRKIAKLGLTPLPGRREIYAWNDCYESDFLGCMAGILRNERFLREGGAVI